MRLTFSDKDINKMPPSHREAVLRAFEFIALKSEATKKDEVEAEEMDTHPVAISERRMKEFVAGISERPRKVLAAIASLEPNFRFGDVLKGMGIEEQGWDELRAVWAALTKRTRTVTKNPQAKLIEWDTDHEDTADVRGIIHPTTFANLRIALGS
ncbi:MAG: hypothetical protein AB7O56_13270 [Bauldia sp.]